MRPARLGMPAAEVAGVSPDGTPRQVGVDRNRVVLLFLTSSCYGCQPLWPGSSAPAGHPTDAAVVLVTPSPETESARKVAALAPGHIPVLMSSAAWHDYGVTQAPWWVVIAGGTVVEDGPAPATWADVAAHLEVPRP